MIGIDAMLTPDKCSRNNRMKNISLANAFPVFLVCLLFLIFFMTFSAFSSHSIGSSFLITEGDDLFIKYGNPENLTFIVLNSGPDNITSVNITLPSGINLSYVFDVSGWSYHNSTQASNTTVSYTNSTNLTSIRQGANETFIIETFLDASASDGTYTIDMTTFDVFLNSSSKQFNVTADSTAPAISVYSPANNSKILAGYAGLQFNATDNYTGIYCNYTTKDVFFETDTLSSQNYYYYSNSSVTMPGLSGVHNFTIICRDHINNTGMSVVLFNYTKFLLDVVYPNLSAQVSDVVNGSVISIYVNASTSSGDILNESGSMNWTIYVNDVFCPTAASQFNGSGDGYWHVNCTAPYLSGNPIYNNLTVHANYTGATLDNYYNNFSVSSNSSYNSTAYRDVTPPVFGGWFNFSSFALNETAVGIEKNSTFVISVNLSDNLAGIDADSVWSEVVLPNTTVNNYNFTQWSLDIWELDINNTNLNLSMTGDYNITVYANDTNNNTAIFKGWFEIYEEAYMTGNLSASGTSGGMYNLTFYHPETGQLMDFFSLNTSEPSGQDINLTVHPRIYDLEMNITFDGLSGKHTLYFHDLDLSGENATMDSKLQINKIEIPQDLGDIGFKNTDIDFFTAGSTAAVGVSVNDSLVHGKVSVTFDYSTMPIGSFSENELHVYRCPKAIIPMQTCNFGDWTDLGTGTLDANITSYLISFEATNFSSYLVAHYLTDLGDEIGGNGGDDDGDGDDGPTTYSSPDISSGSDGPRCGDGICSFDENSILCPIDCAPEFDVETDFDMSNIILDISGNRSYDIRIKNNNIESIVVTTNVTGEGFVSLTVPQEIVIEAGSEVSVPISISVMESATAGKYEILLTLQHNKTIKILPLTVSVVKPEIAEVSVNLDMLKKEFKQKELLKFYVRISIDSPYERNFTINYSITDFRTGNSTYFWNETVSVLKSIEILKNVSLSDGMLLDPGDYILELEMYDADISLKRKASFTIVRPLLSGWVGWVLFSILFAALSGGLFVGYRVYMARLRKRARYLIPTNFSKLPRESDKGLWLGRVAGSSRKAWFDTFDLVTHMLVAGSTGSGKSVAASVFVEEALLKKIPVVIFDPTSQWTGFVKPCKDPNLLKFYGTFGIRRDSARPFPGLLFNVTDPNLEIDFKKYMNPGEVTVFNLASLKPGEYDKAVQKIIQTIFDQSWEEATDLKLLLVFDEVHRLLEKYGGSGGYVALEKACREFRKWGIGLIMASQVNADFKEAVQGNILTEVQLNTKSMTDIKKAGIKYGKEYAERISRQAIGVAMMQNPKYNDGKPWFINFRPTLHQPHKVPDDELALYDKYATMIEKYENKLEALEKQGKDMSDKKLELKLAKDKLKQGRFKMAEIYINSLNEYFNAGSVNNGE